MALGFVREAKDLSDSLFESESAVWTFRRFMVRGAVEGSFDSFAPAESQGSFRAILRQGSVDMSCVWSSRA